jgi:hypothetical protein
MQRFLHEVIEPALHDSALALVQHHRDAGDQLAIVTATNDFVTRPIARRFGVPALIATELERDAAGRVTGAIHGVPAYREGKITRVRQWLAAEGRTLGDFERAPSTAIPPTTCRCSSTSATRWPPTRRPTSSAAARERGWPILRLFE